MRLCSYGHEMVLLTEDTRERWRCYTCQAAHGRDRRDGLASVRYETIDIEPLEFVLTLSGIASSLSYNQERAYHRAHRRGRITVGMADEIACALGMHPSEIWPDWFEEVEA